MRAIDARPIEEAPALDLFSDEFLADPAEAIARVRERSWLARTPLGVAVIDREHVHVLLGDRRLRSAIPEMVAVQGVRGPLRDALATSILALEGEPHARVRRLVNRAFTPRATDVHRPHMREVIGRLVDGVATDGRCEAMTAIADHYPIEVMCHVLGVPDEDHERFAAWNRAITWALSMALAEHVDEIQWGMANMAAYVTELMAARRADPRDDLVTALVHAHENDDRLSDDEVRMMISALLFAGYDTTRNQLGLALWLFCRFPEQWDLLRDDPSLAPRAVEEVMRFRGAVSAVPRITIDDVELDGWLIPAGTFVAVSVLGANHDPDVHDAPSRFDITVDRAPHLTFGGGVHYCLGANLARAELQEALPVLAAAMPHLRLEADPVWRAPTGIYGPEALPIAWA